MTHIAYHKSGRRRSLGRDAFRLGNPLAVYAGLVLGSMLLLGGVAVVAVV
jgi:hypothetical protein